MPGKIGLLKGLQCHKLEIILQANEGDNYELNYSVMTHEMFLPANGCACMQYVDAWPKHG